MAEHEGALLRRLAAALGTALDAGAVAGVAGGERGEGGGEGVAEVLSLYAQLGRGHAAQALFRERCELIYMMLTRVCCCYS